MKPLLLILALNGLRLSAAEEIPLARLYPGDVGLARDAAVLFADDFESGDWRKWVDTDGAVAVTTTAPHAGRHCGQIMTTTGKPGGFAFKTFTPGADRVFARFYVRFSAGFRSADHLAMLCGHVYGDPRYSFGRAGTRPDGKFFTVDLAPFSAGGKNPAPGELALQAFHSDMPEVRSPSGQLVPQRFFPPDRVVPPLDRWQCWEFMVQANSAPDRADGRQAMWVDGKPAGEHTGIRWRGRDDVKIVCLWLEHYGYDPQQPGAPLQQDVCFDDLVVATRYIGPREEPAPKPMPGISVRDLAVAKDEIPVADNERITSAGRIIPTDLIASAPARVAKQLAASRERFGTRETWEKRRAQLREEFLKGAKLWPLPERTPLKPILHSRREHDGYSVENIAIESMPGFFCTGNLYRPLKQTQPGPGVLCPHGHFRPMGRFREEHQIRCAHLARMGATVFSYSMTGWNDSRQTSHHDPLVLALQTLNSLAALDYLCSFPGVDARRIGATGASGGGSQAMFLALLDERVTATCPVGIVYPWMAPLGCLCEGGMPVMQAAETNAIELSAAIAPRAQLFISIGGDQTRDFPQVGFPFVRDIYRLYGEEDAVENSHLPDELHDFGPSKRRAMYAFFAKHLGLQSQPEKADSIAMERPHEMEVFNAEHPMPEHALRGEQAIAAAFEALRRAGR